MSMKTDTGAAVVRSLIPARIDRLPWSPFHTRLVVALGVAWILDGLRSPWPARWPPRSPSRRRCTCRRRRSALIATGLPGRRGGRRAGLRAPVRQARPAQPVHGHPGRLPRRQRADRATPGDGAGWVIFLYATRFIAGMGIGGEYAAINSAIDELIPARYRGRVDIAVNGTYWAGAILGTLGTLLFLNVIGPSAGLAARLPDRPGPGRR